MEWQAVTRRSRRNAWGALLGSLLGWGVSAQTTREGPEGVQFDFGDAGGSGQPTLLAVNGARHGLTGGPALGSSIDSEPDGQPTVLANGDDTAGFDDEDGVFFTSPVAPGSTATVQVQATGAGLSLDAWVDFNADGDWDDPGEQIFSSVTLAFGANALSFPVPPSTLPNAATTARFRASTAGGLGVSGAAPDGEVEDHRVLTTPVELLGFALE